RGQGGLMNAQTTENAPTRKEAAVTAEKILLSAARMLQDVRRHQEELVKKRGVTLLQYTAIQALRRNEPLTVMQLAEKLRLKHSTVSKLVDRMERDRLLVRIQNAEDLRSCKLRLTDKAVDAVQGLSLSMMEFLGRVLGVLTPKEQVDLARLVLKVSGSFQKELGRLEKQKNETAKS
ncbi:MAG: MarR family transcriptional regulator, partial [Bdellovibrionota bacterium]